MTEEELALVNQIRKELNLVIEAMRTLRKLADLNDERIANLENRIFQIPPRKDR